jgi:hypothetical protein
VGGPEPLRLFEEATSGLSRLPPAEARARMETLIHRFPDSPLVARALFWLAEDDHREHRTDDALGAYREIERRWPGTEWGHRAEEAIRRVHGEQAQARRRRLFTAASGVIFAAFLIFYGARAFRGESRRTPLPIEIVYYLPVAALFVAAAATEHGSIARATALLAIGGAALVFFVAQHPPPRRRTLHVAALGLAITALFTFAVRTQGLTDLVLETLRNGAER